VAPAPDAPSRPGAVPPASSEAAGAAGPFLDHGPCRFPDCAHVGPRVCGQLCPTHTLAVLGGVYDRLVAAAASADPIEAGVREATAAAAWWRYPDKAYVDIAKTCLALIKRRGEWPVTHPPTSTDVGKELALSENELPLRGAGRRVFDALKSAKRRTGHPHRFREALEDACAEYEREVQARQRMP
jgi:hypothetical protein